jgi:hypothetical protein
MGPVLCIRFATVDRVLRRRILMGVAILLLFIGLGAYRYQSEHTRFVERPPASGSVGSLHVYGQNEQGPLRLFPGRVWRLRRPQHLAFELQAEGSGPRSIYIELEAGSRRWRMHNERIQTPKINWYLEYIMDLDDNVPNFCTIIVRVVAPHARAVESRFVIQLFDQSKD